MISQGGHVASDETPSRSRILLVDDEPAVLDGLRRHLRGRFEIFTARGGAEALELLESPEPFAAILSDMRMPVMDGAAFLATARQQCPDTVRLLLTGQADMKSTIAAINDSQIYRFLSKPCPRETVEAALQDAVELHRQIRAERSAVRWLEQEGQGPAEPSVGPPDPEASGVSIRAYGSTPRTIRDRLASIRSMTSVSDGRRG